MKCDEDDLLSKKAQTLKPESTQSSNRGSVEESAEPRFLAVGRIAKPHGVLGEVRVELMTDHPERFEWLDAIYVGEKNPRRVPIVSVRYHQDVVLLKLEGYPTRTEAELLRGELLQVPESEAVPLEDDEYFLYQLIGIEVFTEQGRHLGQLTEILETGANNVFVIDNEGRQYLIPDIPDVIREIDIENRRLVIHPMPGLIADLDE
jgi:16S rRNA processing protein RimM